MQNWSALSLLSNAVELCECFDEMINSTVLPEEAVSTEATLLNDPSTTG